MEFIKFIDQTVREIKKEVNVKILKVPEIQQKVYDATSYEPWGSHGSDLTEIAQATKKLEHLALFPLLIGTSTDCKIIMNVLWTGLADGGSNWRNVYKALAVMEYLVAHGSDTAVYDIINHSFQISKEADTILSLLDDKDKIQEVRDKAAADRDNAIAGGNQGIKAKDVAVHNGSDHTASSSSSPKALSSKCSPSQDLPLTTCAEDDFEDFDP
ncbi:hypothetical protein C5167_044232 [Papaver somniferum]|uniref:ENTH domain-containing protein n=1 Tax=Papaver somniferum TaxID=3469 RepID=A0A4Y7LBT4_PAPSO|nr:hypothetical protein C5167_044232 [Papaver somniferum]